MGQDSDSEDDTVAFVRAAISSVCALELLILLRRERRRCFGADQLVRELRSSQLAVAQALEHLTKSGLIEEVPQAGYRYQQASAQLDAICDRLELDYARKPVKIVRAILEAPDEKLRTFADAFRLLGKPRTRCLLPSAWRSRCLRLINSFIHCKHRRHPRTTGRFSSVLPGSGC